MPSPILSRFAGQEKPPVSRVVVCLIRSYNMCRPVSIQLVNSHAMVPDINLLESVREISLLELSAEKLPSRVGAPLPVKKLKELLDVSHETADRWIRILC